MKIFDGGKKGLEIIFLHLIGLFTYIILHGLIQKVWLILFQIYEVFMKMSKFERMFWVFRQETLSSVRPVKRIRLQNSHQLHEVKQN